MLVYRGKFIFSSTTTGCRWLWVSTRCSSHSPLFLVEQIPLGFVS